MCFLQCRQRSATQQGGDLYDLAAPRLSVILEKPCRTTPPPEPMKKSRQITMDLPVWSEHKSSSQGECDAQTLVGDHRERQGADRLPFSFGIHAHPVKDECPYRLRAVRPSLWPAAGLAEPAAVPPEKTNRCIWLRRHPCTASEFARNAAFEFRRHR